MFPNFDDNLRQAFRIEAEMFFDSILREDRSVVDLLTANYTFVNERLARHYGIPNVYGSRFRRVTLDGALEDRRGLLGKGAVLLTTSNPDRTSPVLRGKWVLMNILGVVPPEPPANVPLLRESGKMANGQPVPLEDFDARADAGAPRQPGVRELPHDDGPDWLRAGVVRRHREGRDRTSSASRST